MQQRQSRSWQRQQHPEHALGSIFSSNGGDLLVNANLVSISLGRLSRGGSSNGLGDGSRSSGSLGLSSGSSNFSGRLALAFGSGLDGLAGSGSRGGRSGREVRDSVGVSNVVDLELVRDLDTSLVGFVDLILNSLVDSLSLASISSSSFKYLKMSLRT